jgi:hypothetical protein
MFFCVILYTFDICLVEVALAVIKPLLIAFVNTVSVAFGIPASSLETLSIQSSETSIIRPSSPNQE